MGEFFTHRHNHGPARRLALAAMALLTAATASQADGTPSTAPDCGPDAFSSAQVIERRPPRRGPITAVPDTLCTDLAPQQRPAQVDIHLYPGLGAPVGRDGPGVPYEGRPPRFPPRP